MKTINLKNIALISGCIALAACSGPGQLRSDGYEHIGPYPTNWKKITSEYIKDSYFDPYSVRDSEAAPPVRQKAVFFDSWVVCIRNNAKNKMGGYTGRQTSSLSIQQGQIVHVRSNDDFDCRSARFEPFPLN